MPLGTSSFDPDHLHDIASEMLRPPHVRPRDAVFGMHILQQVWCLITSSELSINTFSTWLVSHLTGWLPASPATGRAPSSTPQHPPPTPNLLSSSLYLGLRVTGGSGTGAACNIAGRTLNKMRAS